MKRDKLIVVGAEGPGRAYQERERPDYGDLEITDAMFSAGLIALGPTAVVPTEDERETLQRVYVAIAMARKSESEMQTQGGA